MSKNFNKISFESDLGYILTHTTGISAEDSTLSYMHQTPKYMLYYFLHGSGNIKIEGKHYVINDGDMVILNPAEMFCCSVDANKFHERIVLHFSANMLKSFPKDCSYLTLPFSDRPKGISNHISSETIKKYSIDKIVKDLIVISQKKHSTKEILTLCKITELLAALCEITESHKETSPTRSTENTTVNKILEYLSIHFTENLTIESISQKFNIDKSYMSHLFKEHVGVSLWNYVIFRRISYFNEIVKNGTNIEEASRIAGFNNYSNFFRLYKKHTGITPIEYKLRRQSF